MDFISLSAPLIWEVSLVFNQKKTHKSISCKRKVVVHAILFWVALLYWDIKGRWNLEYTVISQMSTLVEKNARLTVLHPEQFHSPVYSTKLTTEQNYYPCIAFAIFERAELGNHYLLVFLFPPRQWIADRLESVNLSGWLSLGASCRWCYRKQQGQRGMKRTRLYSTAATDLLGFSYAMATYLIWDPYVVERREQNEVWNWFQQLQMVVHWYMAAFSWASFRFVISGNFYLFPLNSDLEVAMRGDIDEK